MRRQIWRAFSPVRSRLNKRETWGRAGSWKLLASSLFVARRQFSEWFLRHFTPHWPSQERHSLRNSVQLISAEKSSKFRFFSSSEQSETISEDDQKAREPREQFEAPLALRITFALLSSKLLWRSRRNAAFLIVLSLSASKWKLYRTSLVCSTRGNSSSGQIQRSNRPLRMNIASARILSIDHFIACIFHNEAMLEDTTVGGSYFFALWEHKHWRLTLDALFVLLHVHIRVRIRAKRGRERREGGRKNNLKNHLKSEIGRQRV